MKNVYECAIARMMACKERIECLEGRIERLTQENEELRPRAAVPFIELTPRHPDLNKYIEELVSLDEQTALALTDNPRPFIQKYLKQDAKEVPKLTTNVFLEHLVNHVKEMKTQVARVKES